MNLWLDDERKSPRNWVWVKTPGDCIDVLKTFPVDILSLDHDLGIFVDGKEETGYDVLCWLEQNLNYMPNEVRIHTANPVARKRMQLVLAAIERSVIEEKWRAK